jgi:hypothetical protein
MVDQMPIGIGDNHCITHTVENCAQEIRLLAERFLRTFQRLGALLRQHGALSNPLFEREVEVAQLRLGAPPFALLCLETVEQRLYGLINGCQIITMM